MPEVIDLPIWVVYDQPRDHPDSVVVRRQWPLTGGGSTADIFGYLFWNLDEARRFCANMGLVSLARHPGDDPVIVETWL